MLALGLCVQLNENGYISNLSIFVRFSPIKDENAPTFHFLHNDGHVLYCTSILYQYLV